MSTSPIASQQEMTRQALAAECLLSTSVQAEQYCDAIHDKLMTEIGCDALVANRSRLFPAVSREQLAAPAFEIDLGALQPFLLRFESSFMVTQSLLEVVGALSLLAAWRTSAPRQRCLRCASQRPKLTP